MSAWGNSWGNSWGSAWGRRGDPIEPELPSSMPRYLPGGPGTQITLSQLKRRKKNAAKTFIDVATGPSALHQRQQNEDALLMMGIL